jgi:hypothetical protein
VPFNKRSAGAPWDRSRVRAFQPMEPVFGAIGFESHLSMAERAQLAQARAGQQRALSRLFWRMLDTIRYGGMGALAREARSFFAYHLGRRGAH